MGLSSVVTPPWRNIYCRRSHQLTLMSHLEGGLRSDSDISLAVFQQNSDVLISLRFPPVQGPFSLLFAEFHVFAVCFRIRRTPYGALRLCQVFPRPLKRSFFHAVFFVVLAAHRTFTSATPINLVTTWTAMGGNLLQLALLEK